MTSQAAIKAQKQDRPNRVVLNAFIGLIAGLAGGLVGLGGAELRLPYLAGTLGLPLKKAVPANLAVSLLTLLAALPTRLLTLKTASLKPFLYETAALGLGAVLGAYAGVSGAVSPQRLGLSCRDVTIRACTQFSSLVVSFLCAIPLVGQSGADFGQIIGVVKDLDQAVIWLLT